MISAPCVRSAGHRDALVSGAEVAVGGNDSDEPAARLLVVKYDGVGIVRACRSLAAQTAHPSKNAADLPRGLHRSPGGLGEHLVGGVDHLNDLGSTHGEIFVGRNTAERPICRVGYAIKIVRKGGGNRSQGVKLLGGIG